MLIEIIEGIAQIRKGTSKEHERVDLNTPLHELGVPEAKIPWLLNLLETETKRKIKLEETGVSAFQLSRMTVMRIWNFCEENMYPKPIRESELSQGEKQSGISACWLNKLSWFIRLILPKE